MKNNNINQNRRDFLKKTSLGVAGASLSGGVVGSVIAPNVAAAESSMQTVVTAAHWGPLGVVVQDGKVVKSGPAIEPVVPNELQSVVADQLYSETRVKYPMVRKGFLANPGKSDTTMRGRDEWVRVSWDEALDLVHNQLKRVREQYGATGIFAGSYGWFSCGSLHASRTLLRRYMNATGGFGLSYHYSNGGVPTATGGIIGSITATPAAKPGAQTWLDDTSKSAFPLARIADVLLNPGKKIQYNGTEITYPDIKAVYWAGGNPFVHHQDTNTLVKAFQQPEVVIVNEVNWTPTARMADIVLPATTSYERNDLTMAGDYSMMSIYPMKQVVPPQFEAKNDYDIFVELAKRAGVEEQYTEGKTEMEWLEEFYNTAVTAARTNRVTMPRFDKFWAENKPLSFEAGEAAKKWVRYGEFREDPLLNPLGTPSGKIEIYSDVVAKMNYDDCKGHASWMEPEEFAGNVTQEYPLALVTPHPYYRLHSQLAHTSLRQKYAVNDREPVMIHPEDAAARGIKDGDIVRIHSKRGQVLAGAVVTENIIKGTVALHEGAWYDPMDLGESEKPLCKNGCPNVLTRDEGTSKLAQGNSPNTCIVQVEKFVGQAPEVTVFKQPKHAA